MHRILTGITLLAFALIQHVCDAKPIQEQNYHPVVIWHGLGDSAFSEPMQNFASELREQFPGMYVRIVNLADDLAGDQRASFFGSLNVQVDKVCSDLENDEKLKNGFDAMGFSQGGQFMRAYVERCNRPSVRNLVTFGSQHMGISDLPACKPTELLCRLAETALRGGVFTEYAQSNIVTAQYYRDPTSADRYEKYLSVNLFLTDINNEITLNETYKQNLIDLDNIVLLMFDHDITVEPKQSSWFASYAIDTGDEPGKEKEVIPLRQTDSYESDRLGLRTLDERGSLIMELCKGAHMQIDAACLSKVLGKYVGTSPPTVFVPTQVRHTWYAVIYRLTRVRASTLPAELHIVTLMIFGSILLVCLRMLSSHVRTKRIALH